MYETQVFTAQSLYDRAYRILLNMPGSIDDVIERLNQFFDSYNQLSIERGDELCALIILVYVVFRVGQHD